MAKRTTVADVRKSAAAVGASGARVLKSVALAAAGTVLGTVESAAETGQAALRGVSGPARRKRKVSARKRAGAKKAGAGRKARRGVKRGSGSAGAAKKTVRRLTKKAKSRVGNGARSAGSRKRASKRPRRTA